MENWQAINMVRVVRESDPDRATRPRWIGILNAGSSRNDQV
jgi:hypothetical protein